MLDVRKLAAAALLCLFWFSGTAHALIPTVQQWRTDAGLGAPGSTKLEACNNTVAAVNAVADQGQTDWVNGGMEETRCAITSVGANYGYWTNFLALDPICPANSSSVSGGCQCASGFEENAGKTACQAPAPTCTPGTPVSGGYFDAGTSASGGPPAVVCKGGCSVAFDGTFPAGSAIVGGKKHYFAQGTYSNLGSTCANNAIDGSGTSVSSLPADSCAPGQQMGTFNGKSVCADAPGSDGKGEEKPVDAPKVETGTKTESTVTNGDGSTTKTTTEVTTGAGGAKTTTTTTTTTSADGKSTTGTTTKTTEPGVGKGEEGEEGEKTECEKNSSAEGCGGEPTEPSGGAFYTKKEKTVASIFEGAKVTLQASPVGGAVGGFFTVSAGGSCTASSGTIAYFNRSYSFDSMCSQMAMNLYLLMKGVLLLLASWYAFRIAIE